MNKIDWSTYNFRCSSLPTLMVNSRSKSDILSETAKAKLEEIWIQEVWNRERFDTTNKYTEKGVLCEPDAMDLIQKVTKQTYFKNKTEFSNDFIKGTPDIVENLGKENCLVKDTKCSWNIWTFAGVDEIYALKTYYYQILGYMWLTSAKTGDIVFCLVNTPDEIMMEELRKLAYKYPEIDESEEKAEKYIRNYKFDDIPEKERMKVFKVEYNEDDVNTVQERLQAAREYLKGLSL